METSYSCDAWRPPYPLHHHHHHHHPMILSDHHYHHHHHHHTILCPLHHHHHLIICHSHISPTPAPLPLPNRLNLGSTPVQNEAHHSGTLVLQEQEYDGLEEGQVEEEGEEEEEPIFVLTDDWREFFAKSEAKRKLEKRQAKKKQKN